MRMHTLMLLKLSLSLIEILPVLIDIIDIIITMEICNRNSQLIFLLLIPGLVPKHGKQMQQRGLST